MMRGFIYGILAAFAAIGGISSAAPQPAIVPGPDDWTVEVKFEHPQQIVIKRGTKAQRSKGTEAQSTSHEQRPRRFWYTLITLTNTTNRDVDFYPTCELMTDTFQIISAGKRTPAAVFERIKRRHQRKYPFLERLEKSGNKILQGEDNTKDIAVIWPDFDARAKNIKLFIAGLSNETVAVDHPTEKDEQGRPVKVFLRKTLELTYNIGGDPALRSKAKLTYKDKRWIMR